MNMVISVVFLGGQMSTNFAMYRCVITNVSLGMGTVQDLTLVHVKWDGQVPIVLNVYVYQVANMVIAISPLNVNANLVGQECSVTSRYANLVVNMVIAMHQENAFVIQDGQE